MVPLLAQEAVVPFEHSQMKTDTLIVDLMAVVVDDDVIVEMVQLQGLKILYPAEKRMIVVDSMLDFLELQEAGMALELDGPSKIVIILYVLLLYI